MSIRLSIYNTITSGLFTLLLLHLFSTVLFSQTHSISIASELTHVGANTKHWINASGFKAGYLYTLSNDHSISVEYGHTSFFNGDKSKGDIVTLSLLRSLKSFQILKSSYHWNLLSFQRSNFTFHMGPSFRLTSEVLHNRAYVTTLEKSTEEVAVTTSYHRTFNMGVNAGFSFTRNFTQKIDGVIFIELDNYGGDGNSFLTTGLKTLIKI